MRHNPAQPPSINKIENASNAIKTALFTFLIDVIAI